MQEIVTTIHNAKTHLSKYLAMLERREIDRVVIKRRDVVVAHLGAPPMPEKRKRIFGIMKDQIKFDKSEMDEAAKEIEDLFYASMDHLDDQTSH